MDYHFPPLPLRDHSPANISGVSDPRFDAHLRVGLMDRGESVSILPTDIKTMFLQTA